MSLNIALNMELWPSLVPHLEPVLERRVKMQEYFDNPTLWAYDMLGVKLWSKQREIADSLQSHRRTAVKAGHGVGKLLAPGTPIPVPLTQDPSGFKLAQDLVPGDTVLDEQGKPTIITGVSPVWDQQMYEIVFDDGSTVVAGEKHEWNVFDLSRRTAAMKRGVRDWREHWDITQTYETEELYNEGLLTKSGQRRWRIPLTKPIQLPEQDLLIDPYLLGLWLGDGDSHQGVLTLGNKKMDALEHIHRSHTIRNTSSYEAHRVLVTGLTEELRELNLLRNKHIPMQYLRASEQQRRELLAGLMDSDGFCATNSNAVGMDLTNERLSHDVYQLLTSLGNKVYRQKGVAAYTKEGQRTITGTRYRMNWTALENPFKVRGDDWVAPTHQRSRHTQRTIVEIRKLGRDKNFCISVDSPSHLYLATEHMIPTHNSYLAAILSCWWVDTRYPRAFLATTAPSWDQVNGIIWREIRKVYRMMKQRYEEGLIDHQLPGYITSEAQWKDKDGMIIGWGRKPPDNAEDVMQGIHEDYVLAIGDESVGLPKALISSLQNITSGEGCRLLLLCNPTNPVSEVGKIFQDEDSTYNKLTISVLESPNFTDEAKNYSRSELSRFTSRDYPIEILKENGGDENSLEYQARVLGEFTFNVDNAFFHDGLVMKSFRSQKEIDAEELIKPWDRPVLGVDVAGSGGDKCVAFVRHGSVLRMVGTRGGDAAVVNHVETALWIDQLARQYGCSWVRIDGVGMGEPIAHMVAGFSKGMYQVRTLIGNATSPNRHRWLNQRAYWYDMLRQAFIHGNVHLLAEETGKLRDDLLAIKYEINPKGGIQIESKKDLKKRGGKSPDFADAAIYAFVTVADEDPDMPHLEPGDMLVGDGLDLDELQESMVSALPW